MSLLSRPPTKDNMTSPQQFMQYTNDSGLKKELFAKVRNYFKEAGIARSGGGRLAFKIATIYCWFAGSYALLLLSTPIWASILAALSLGLSIGCIGTCIMHESNHGACFRSQKVNRLLGYSLDLIGGSSYYWRWSHGLHHRYPNIENLDYDIDIMPVLRLAPWQKHHWAHRFQKYYVWLLFTLTAPKWNFIDDYRDIIRGTVGKVTVARPKGKDLLYLLAFKAFFYCWAFILPIYLLGVAKAVLLYIVWTSVTGIVLGGLFQLGHLTDESGMTEHPGDSKPLGMSFIAVQIRNTANFKTSALIDWYAGGLNYQIEHHLFPHISHIHYPALAPLVEEFCADNGIEYNSQPTMWKALKRHFYNLGQLGQAPKETAETTETTETTETELTKETADEPSIGALTE